MRLWQDDGVRVRGAAHAEVSARVKAEKERRGGERRGKRKERREERNEDRMAIGEEIERWAVTGQWRAKWPIRAEREIRAERCRCRIHDGDCDRRPDTHVQ